MALNSSPVEPPERCLEHLGLLKQLQPNGLGIVDVLIHFEQLRQPRASESCTVRLTPVDPVLEP